MFYWCVGKGVKLFSIFIFGMKMVCVDDLVLFVCIVVLGSFFNVVCEVDLLFG